MQGGLREPVPTRQGRRFARFGDEHQDAPNIGDRPLEGSRDGFL